MRKLIIAILFILILSPKVCADLEWRLQDYPQFNEYTARLAAGENPFTPESVLDSLSDALFGEISRSKVLLAEIMSLAAAAGVLKLVCRGSASDAAYFTSYTLMSIAVVKLLCETAGYGSEVIHSICEFITVLAPVLTGLIAASGTVTSAAAFSPILSGAVYIFTLAVDKLIKPMIYMSAVIGIVGNISTEVRLESFNKLIRSASRWILTALFTVFTGLCALYGFNAPVLDAIGAKTAKFAVGTLVPVVGGLLADTMETVAGGTRILRNAVGSAGMICVITTAAVPIIKVWAVLFLFKLCTALSEPLCDRRMSLMLRDAAESVGVILSVMLTAVMLFIITIGIMLGSTGFGQGG